jgi:hypothetical protein
MGIDKVSLPARPLAVSPPRIGSKSVLAGVIAAIAASASPSAFAEIELGEGFSVSGFADMSIWSFNPDGGPTVKNAAIDQFETDFMFAGSNGISAQVDVEYSNDFEDVSTTFVEQAFITKKFNDQFSVKMGRFLSYTGWETEEPTGLFQYSGAGNGMGYAQNFYGYYQNGVSAYYDGGMFDVMASVVTSTFDPYDTDPDDLGYEVGLALTPVEGLTAKVFYMSDEDSDTDVINAWVSYSMSGFTFAGEYNTADYAGGAEGDGFLLMGNYASGPFGITLRYHDYDIDGGADVSGFTISPSYKASDNLLIVAEYRTDDDSRGDYDQIALEALFTF